MVCQITSRALFLFLCGYICSYDRFHEGGYLHLKSSIMRTHGTKEQRMAVIDSPRKNMRMVVEVFTSYH